METEENPGIEMMSNSQGLIGSFGDDSTFKKQTKSILDADEIEQNFKKKQKEQEDEDEQIRRDEEAARKAGHIFFNIGNSDDKKENKKQKRVLIGIENLVGDRTQIHTKIDTASTLSSAAAAASGLVTVLAASGIGMPVSALLAGALLVANKMLDLYKNNLLLRLLMQDAIFIIMDCYLLFSLIEKSYEIIGTYDDPENKCSNEKSSEKRAMTQQEFKDILTQGKTAKDIAKIQEATSSIRKYQINGIMQAQLKYQIEKLIKTLLSIMETKTLKIIEQDPALHNNAFGKLLLSEKTKREAESYFTYSKFDRNYNRKFGSSIYITEINNALTIINSYLVLLKSNLDTLLKKFEILSPNEYHNIWRAILCSKEYNEYIKPNTQDVINMAKTDVRTVDPDKLIKAIDFVDTVGQNAEAEASRGGSGRSYLRPRIKRKTERRQKKRKQRTKGRRRPNKKSKRRT